MRNITILTLALFLCEGLLAQNTLTVKCFTDNRLYNAIYLNGEIAEYGVCDTGFYVGVFDYETCEIWKTNFNNNNPAHDFANYNNNNEVCRMRSEGFFLFRYDQASELNGMLNMIQQIPEGNPLVIYTPIMYDPVTVASTSPALMTELETRWGAGTMADPEIKILYGNQGNVASYGNMTRLPGSDSVVYSAPVCSSLGMNEAGINNFILIKVSEQNWQVAGVEILNDVELFSLNGQRFIPEITGNEIHLGKTPAAGIYLVRGNSEKGRWQGRIIVY